LVWVAVVDQLAVLGFLEAEVLFDYPERVPGLGANVCSGCPGQILQPPIRSIW